MEDEILRLSTEFREAIRLCARRIPNDLPTKFRLFPKDMCEFSSNLLGRYLAENGFKHVRYILGRRALSCSPGDEMHAWLEIDGIIVDITADQFPDGLGPVIVTRDTKWHARFQVSECRDVVGFERTRGMKDDWDDLYLKVKRHLPSARRIVETRRNDEE